MPVEWVGPIGDAVTRGEFLARFEDLDELIGWFATIAFGMVIGGCSDFFG